MKYCPKPQNSIHFKNQLIEFYKVMWYLKISEFNEIILKMYTVLGFNVVFHKIIENWKKFRVEISSPIKIIWFSFDRSIYFASQNSASVVNFWLLNKVCISGRTFRNFWVRRQIFRASVRHGTGRRDPEHVWLDPEQPGAGAGGRLHLQRRSGTALAFQWTLFWRCCRIVSSYFYESQVGLSWNLRSEIFSQAKILHPFSNL